MTTSLSRVVVSVDDLDRSLVLYGEVLGLSAHRRAEVATLQAANGVDVLLHQRPSTASDTAVAATFTVDDLDAVCAGWSRHGGTVVDAPAVQPWGERMAVVRDCDGHLVCLVGRA